MGPAPANIDSERMPIAVLIAVGGLVQNGLPAHVAPPSGVRRGVARRMPCLGTGAGGAESVA